MNFEIGSKIRQLRLAMGMTQEQLAGQLGLSAQAVSKWENGSTMPDIQLLPELSILLGVTIDTLFSLSDEDRMRRIENMLEQVRFLPQAEFDQTVNWLKARRGETEHRAQATLLLAEVYNKRAEEYHQLAAPLARQALALNGDCKAAHNAVFEAERGPFQDWNYTNHHALIGFYKDVLHQRPQEPRNYYYLLDLLIDDGRTAEALEVVEQMRQVDDSYHYELERGLICKAACDLPGALDWWKKMTEKEPDNWVVWACYADQMARLCRYDEAEEYYRKAMPLRKAPRFCDPEECIGHLRELQGDYAGAIEMQRQILELLKSDWNVTEGEGVDAHLREIERLRSLIK